MQTISGLQYGSGGQNIQAGLKAALTEFDNRDVDEKSDNDLVILLSKGTDYIHDPVIEMEIEKYNTNDISVVSVSVGNETVAKQIENITDNYFLKSVIVPQYDDLTEIIPEIMTTICSTAKSSETINGIYNN